MTTPRLSRPHSFLPNVRTGKRFRLSGPRRFLIFLAGFFNVVRRRALSLVCVLLFTPIPFALLHNGRVVSVTLVAPLAHVRATLAAASPARRIEGSGAMAIGSSAKEGDCCGGRAGAGD